MIIRVIEYQQCGLVSRSINNAKDRRKTGTDVSWQYLNTNEILRDCTVAREHVTLN